MNAARRSADFSPLQCQACKRDVGLFLCPQALNFDLVVPKNADKVSMDAFSGVRIASPGGNDAKMKRRECCSQKTKLTKRYEDQIDYSTDNRSGSHSLFRSSFHRSTIDLSGRF